jgi:hypothetical protein
MAACHLCIALFSYFSIPIANVEKLVRIQEH